MAIIPYWIDSFMQYNMPEGFTFFLTRVENHLMPCTGGDPRWQVVGAGWVTRWYLLRSVKIREKERMEVEDGEENGWEEDDKQRNVGSKNDKWEDNMMMGRGETSEKIT